jgi:hypothetical protein
MVPVSECNRSGGTLLPHIEQVQVLQGFAQHHEVQGLFVVGHILELVFVEVDPNFSDPSQFEPCKVCKAGLWFLKLRYIETVSGWFLIHEKGTQKALKNSTWIV